MVDDKPATMTNTNRTAKQREGFFKAGKVARFVSEGLI
jgi:hypothetical protein